MTLDLLTADESKIEVMAKNLGVTFEKGMSRPKKVDLIRKATIRKEETARNEIRAENQVVARQKLGYTNPDLATKRPAPETVAIQASKLVIAKFSNRENPPTPEGEAGAEIEFDKGAYHFKLYDGHKYCMPEIMVTDNPMSCKDVFDELVKFWMAPWPKQEPLNKDQAEKMAETVMRSINLCYSDADHQTPCTSPKHKRIQNDPERVKEGQMVAYDVAERGFERFAFNILGEAPKGSAIGSFVD